MANECPGMLGRKVGMTQIFLDNGDVVPVTVIETNGNVVLQLKRADGADGYNAVQLGIDEQKPQRVTKAELGHVAKAGAAPQRFVHEIRVDEAGLVKYELGKEPLVADFFQEGEKLDVTGISKGRGFSGVMRRYNFAGFMRTHGTHEFFRHGGSIGTRLTPGHVLKGKKMPGQSGNWQVSVQNLRLVRVDAEKKLLYVAGGVPGPKGGYVTVRKAVRS